MKSCFSDVGPSKENGPELSVPLLKNSEEKKTTLLSWLQDGWVLSFFTKASMVCSHCVSLIYYPYVNHIIYIHVHV